MKKIFYVLFVLGLILVFLPFFIVIAFLEAFLSGFPIIFTQKRTGLNGKPFFIYKFRTMRTDAEMKQKALTKYNEADGPVFKIRNDPRFTGVGKFLAHTGLDELPQLCNILRGDMTLIGLRPLPVPEAAKLKSWQKERQKIKPGIISPWILEGYHTQTFDAWMKSDIAYATKKSIPYDLVLAGRTVVFLIGLFVREISPRD